ncbi:hypothetical protein HDU78_011215 [Chytriomyces hyalinus]|uniref:Uncharacterized protein n=1 Tax=Chytriomyces confervae TaxID=246404 RepID=A0A507FJN3_9FUNG|nr:hypothetical protein HDU78_011215 [Chytriomyces hyalinus]KAJ3264425.1 hypothetical protein HDU77_008588 [Chytriomyces hyalinus]KAJ3403816.1 hypothetical protein HDU80_003720 [Chytriomyces hyalinus]TPX75618.1 hypothetical protein CcCBS67573_g03103 [Chytriomyces confervae]
MLSELYVDHPNETPSKPSSHPFLLIRQDAVNREVHDQDCLHKELFVHSDKSIDGLFVNAADAAYLGLKEAGTADTLYGTVVRYSPLHISFLSHSHSLPLKNVYQLPAAFAHTKFADGVIGINVLFTLGVSVAFDRGYVYLVRSGFESIVTGADKPDEGEETKQRIFADLSAKPHALDASEEEDGSEFDEFDSDQ